MNYAPAQTDFSAGELSPRLWGHFQSDLYKAGLARAANMIPTQQGSIASRAGSQLISDGLRAPVPSGSNTVLLPVLDGPAGDFQLEIQPGGNVRMLNRYGSNPFGPMQKMAPFYAALANGNDVWADPLEQKVFIRNTDTAPGTSARNVDLTIDTAQVGVGASLLLNFFYAGTGLIAERYNGVTLVDTFLVAPGWNSFPINLTLYPGLTIRFRTALGYGLAAIDIWGIQLFVTGSGLFALATGIVGSLGVRLTSFWTKATASPGYTYTLPDSADSLFVIVVVGPAMLPQVIWYSALNNTWSTAPAQFIGSWTDSANNLTSTTPPWLTAGAVISVIAFQNRLWFGLSDNKGSLHATSIGYGRILSSGSPVPIFNISSGNTFVRTGLTGTPVIGWNSFTSKADTLYIYKNGAYVRSEVLSGAGWRGRAWGARGRDRSA